MSGIHPPTVSHRRPTDSDDRIHTDRVRRPPRLRSQAVVVALVPAMVWVLSYPALVLTAIVAAALTAAVVALGCLHRRRARRPAPLAE